MVSRRNAIGATGLTAGWSLIPGTVLGANERINLAAIGIGQQGGNILRTFANNPNVNIVALCDVDIDSDAPLASRKSSGGLGWGRLGGAPATNAALFPGVPRFRDYRSMFDKMANQIDAVCIGVPDHSHFPISMAAMMLGKAVYVEKPLARTFQECELLMQAEKKFGVVTQMGNQGHSGDNYHQFKLWKETGIIKDVTHVDAQMNNARRWHRWRDVAGFPARQPCPVGLNWNEWLGTTAPAIDFNEKLHYGNWRGWHQFGTGCFGDWGAHILDTIHEFLELGLPSSFSAKKLVQRNDYIFPLQSTINFAFPERNGMPAMDIDWYDGQRNYAPTPKDMGNNKFTSAGKVIYSKELVFYGESHGSALQVVPYEKFKQMLIDGAVSNKYGKHSSHHANFINAVRGTEKTRSPFKVAGPLCQMFALGCIAQRLGGSFQFDREKKQIIQNPRADALLHDAVRPGWEQYYTI